MTIDLNELIKKIEKIKTPLQLFAFVIVAILAIVKMTHAIPFGFLLFILIALPFFYILVILRRDTLIVIENAGNFIKAFIFIIFLCSFSFSSYLTIHIVNGGNTLEGNKNNIFKNLLNWDIMSLFNNNLSKLEKEEKTFKAIDITLGNYFGYYENDKNFSFHKLDSLKNEHDKLLDEIITLKVENIKLIYGDKDTRSLISKLTKARNELYFTRYVSNFLLSIIYGGRNSETHFRITFSKLEMDFMNIFPGNVLNSSKNGVNVLNKPINQYDTTDLNCFKKTLIEMGIASDKINNLNLTQFIDTLKNIVPPEISSKKMMELAEGNNFGVGSQLVLYGILIKYDIVDIKKAIVKYADPESKEFLNRLLDEKLDLFNSQDGISLKNNLNSNLKDKIDLNQINNGIDSFIAFEASLYPIPTATMDSKNVYEYIANTLAWIASSNVQAKLRYWGTIDNTFLYFPPDQQNLDSRNGIQSNLVVRYSSICNSLNRIDSSMLKLLNDD